jgi:CheY-like chemotaxis protein
MTAPLLPDRQFRRSVLVVDDDPTAQQFFGQVLKTAGYSVFEACNGLECKSMIQFVHFDVVILDLNMPEMDGYEVLQFARSQLPELKIIVASGFVKGMLLKAAMRLGAVAMLNKPVPIAALLSTVFDVIAGLKPNEGEAI